MKLKNKKIKNFSSPNGFTFIELIIVFSVMAIVSTIGLASFVNYSRTQTLNNAVWDLTTMLNKAKSNTQSQVISGTCSPFKGYKVLICPDSCNSTGDYELDIVCDDDNVLIESKKLPSSDISFSSDPVITTSKSFLFKALLGGVEGAGNVGIKGYGTTKKVGVDSAGNIKVE